MIPKRIAPTIDMIGQAEDELIVFLRTWATREFEAGEDQKIMPILPETMLSVLNRLVLVEAAVKMGVTAH